MASVAASARRAFSARRPKNTSGLRLDARRTWLLTNTCYGKWLPGDGRGFVGQVWEHRANEPITDTRVTHNVVGTQYDRTIPGLLEAATRKMKGPPINLTRIHAEVLLRQFQETAGVRNWSLLGAAIMFNHFHLVVSVRDDLDPSRILGDFKSWGTRALTNRFGAPPSQTWWTERGSKRKLPDERAVVAAVRYVLYDQPRPLVTWSPQTLVVFGAPPR